MKLLARFRRTQHLLLLLRLLGLFQGCSASSLLRSRAQPRDTAKASPRNLPQSLIPSRRLIAGPSDCPTLSGNSAATFGAPTANLDHDAENITCLPGTSDVESAADTCHADPTCVAVLLYFKLNQTCLKYRVFPLYQVATSLGTLSTCIYLRLECPDLGPDSGFAPARKDVDSYGYDMGCNSDVDAVLGAQQCRDDPKCVAFVVGYAANHTCFKYAINSTLDRVPLTDRLGSCFYNKTASSQPPLPTSPSPPPPSPPPPPSLNVAALAAGLSAALVVLVLGACALFRFRHKVRALIGIRGSKGGARGDGYQFSEQEISEATRSFSRDNFLGLGGFGEVYYGKLSAKHPRYPGQEVAVKRQLRTKSKLAEADFFREAQILSTVRHRNVVELLGFCEGRGERYLVYEFVERGSLHKILKQQEPGVRGNAARGGILMSEATGAVTSTSGSNTSTKTGDTGVSSQSSKAGGKVGGTEPLRWASRIKIAVGAARGLRYLHYELKQEILHLDIKSDNILVDAQFNAKVADFGISKMREESPTDNANGALPPTETQSTPQGHSTSHTSTSSASSLTVTGREGSVAPEVGTAAAAQTTLATGHLHGTRGYMDPAYFANSTLTRGSDVYSFGIVLLELATGWFPIGLKLDNLPVSLPKLVLRLVNSEGFSVVCAPSIAESLSEDASPFALELLVGDAGNPETSEDEAEKGSAGFKSGVSELGGATRILHPAVFKRFLCLAMWCCVHERDLRPDMDQVFVILKEVEQGKWRCRRDLGEGKVLDPGGKLNMELFIHKEEEGFSQEQPHLTVNKMGEELEV